MEINVKEIAKRNIFLKNLDEIERISKEKDVDVSTALSMFYQKYTNKLEHAEYTKQVKEFRKVCVKFGYDFAKIRKEIGM